MLNFIKKLLFSNRYSLLILLIFSLVIRLVRDYSIILSFIVLLVLYIILGIAVEIVLEKYFPSLSDKTQIMKQNAHSQANNEKSNTAQRTRRQPQPQSRPQTQTKTQAETQTEAQAQSRTERRMPQTAYRPERKTAQRTGSASSYDHSAIREHSVPDGEPKVTSSYIKNAEAVPRDIERKLIRTAADFNSIKQHSERLSSGEQQARRVYGTSANRIIDNPEDLYTNKKTRERENLRNISKNSISNAANSDVNEMNDINDINERVAHEETDKRRETEKNNLFADRYATDNYFSDDEYHAASSEELDKISEDISREVTKRVTSQRSARKTHIMLPQDSYDEYPYSAYAGNRNVQRVRNSQTASEKNTDRVDNRADNRANNRVANNSTNSTNSVNSTVNRAANSANSTISTNKDISKDISADETARERRELQTGAGRPERINENGSGSGMSANGGDNDGSRVNTRKTKVYTDDMVTADMEKIDRLFDRTHNAHNDSDEYEDNNKAGFLSRFKKKR